MIHLKRIIRYCTCGCEFCRDGISLCERCGPLDTEFIELPSEIDPVHLIVLEKTFEVCEVCLEVAETQI